MAYWATAGGSALEVPMKTLPKVLSAALFLLLSGPNPN
jgi:hypothetical protein